MKAARYYKGEKALRIEEVPKPEPGPGEVLIKVAACGVCHTDLHYLDHGVPTFKEPPMIIGHEISGIVETLGDGVTHVNAGDHVIIPAVLTCGQCAACRRGRENICENMLMVGNNIDGGYAEYIAVAAKRPYSIAQTPEPGKLFHYCGCTFYPLPRGGEPGGNKTRRCGGGVRMRWCGY